MCSKILSAFEDRIENHTVIKCTSNCETCSEEILTMNAVNEQQLKTNVEIIEEEEEKEMLSVCLMCKSVFPSTNISLEHLKTHHKVSHDQSYLFIRKIPSNCISDCKRIQSACICMICKKTFVNKYTCITHINTYHNKKINCKSINYNKWYRSLSEEPEESTSQEESVSSKSDSSYSCCLCGKILSCKSSCLRHLRKQHNINDESFCDDPLTLCKKSEANGKSSRIPTKTVCLLCYKVFQRKSNCFQHLLVKHKKDAKNDEKSSELFVEFKCKTSIVQESSIEENSEKSKKKCYQCDICAKLFKSLAFLKRHMKTHQDIPQFSCSLCEKSFRGRKSLKYHEDFVHKLIYQFSCQICQKVFSTALTLRQHQTIHTGEKPFTCDLCRKDFRLKSSLEYHMKIHSGERPFVCSFCSKVFKSRKDCKNHERVHTRQKPFACRHCGKAFGHSSARYKHEKSHERL
ncbi:gastrula zinc finger protein XlCGF26.1-like [Phlebotomus argentipes]|uniref:gastrula zinc finger protein XlCGF26.1-like n=1 Tax=Phlebotomus argentipes TaxID=94469 RepID=UPI002892D8C3|nr:gastrula zinc finger protein XlCGF26.1-like [Phlebotomus argentipes]